MVDRPHLTIQPEQEKVRSSDREPSTGVLRLASTTSTRDSGLFDVLLPVFEASINAASTSLSLSEREQR